LQGLRALLVKTVREQAAHETFRALAQELAGRRICLDHLARGRVDDEHGFGGDLKQQTVTGLRLAKFEILALHGLLRAHQLLLQRGHRLHAAAESDDLTGAVDLNGGIKHRQIRARRRPVIHHAPAGHTLGGGIAQQGFNLGPAVRRDRFSPGLANPFIRQFAGELVVAEGNISNQALPRIGNHQCDIGRNRDQPGRRFTV